MCGLRTLAHLDSGVRSAGNLGKYLQGGVTVHDNHVRCCMSDCHGRCRVEVGGHLHSKGEDLKCSSHWSVE